MLKQLFKGKTTTKIFIATLYTIARDIDRDIARDK